MLDMQVFDSFDVNSNNYNMKNTHYKCQQALQILIDINILREDTYLFSKIALFQSDKKQRYQYYIELNKLEQQRNKIQSQLDICLDQIEINQYWKTYLFQFSNKIYKNIKHFHQKLMTFSNKIAQITQTNAFLLLLRNSCIQKLSESKNLKHFINLILQKVRQRMQKQFLLLNNFGTNNKMIELAKKDENSKNNRYLSLLKQKESKLFFIFHNRALLKMQMQVKKIIGKQIKQRIDRLNPYELLDIQQQNPYQTSYVMQNGMAINLVYRQDGFCQFITTKYNRIVKDLITRNGYNQTFINQFRNKYNEIFNKTKKAIKFNQSNTFYDHFQKNQHRKSQRNSQLQLSSSIEMKNITNIKFGSRQQNSVEQQSMVDLPKKSNAFKIQKVDSRKKSHTLRPLCQSKQNNKEVVHQKLIQMKLQEEPLQIAKIIRIRKRKNLPLFKEQTGWSLMVKQEKSKLSFLIH